MWWRRLVCRLVGHRVDLDLVDRTGFRCACCRRYVRVASEHRRSDTAGFRAVIEGVASLHAGFRCAGLTGQIVILVDFDDFATIASMRELSSQLVSDPHWARNGLQIAGVSVRLDLPAARPDR